jgi:RimJ/RimL family protein N-acetyltransferase
VSDALRLRELRDEDLPVLYAHQRDPEAVRMAQFPSRDHDAFMAHWARVRADPVNLVRVIDLDGQVAGTVLSFPRDGVREVGYWIDRALWGRGIATRALRAFLEVDPERPLYAGVAKHNAGSLRVLEKCGFRPHHETEEDFILVLDPATLVRP